MTNRRYMHDYGNAYGNSILPFVFTELSNSRHLTANYITVLSSVLFCVFFCFIFLNLNYAMN